MMISKLLCPRPEIQNALSACMSVERADRLKLMSCFFSRAGVPGRFIVQHVAMHDRVTLEDLYTVLDGGPSNPSIDEPKLFYLFLSLRFDRKFFETCWSDKSVQEFFHSRLDEHKQLPRSGCKFRNLFGVPCVCLTILPDDMDFNGLGDEELAQALMEREMFEKDRVKVHGCSEKAHEKLIEAFNEAATFAKYSGTLHSYGHVSLCNGQLAREKSNDFSRSLTKVIRLIGNFRRTHSSHESRLKTLERNLVKTDAFIAVRRPYHTNGKTSVTVPEPLPPLPSYPMPQLCLPNVPALPAPVPNTGLPLDSGSALPIGATGLLDQLQLALNTMEPNRPNPLPAPATFELGSFGLPSALETVSQLTPFDLLYKKNLFQTFDPSLPSTSAAAGGLVVSNANSVGVAESTEQPVEEDAQEKNLFNL